MIRLINNSSITNFRFSEKLFTHVFNNLLCICDTGRFVLSSCSSFMMLLWIFPFSSSTTVKYYPSVTIMEVKVSDNESKLNTHAHTHRAYTKQSIKTNTFWNLSIKKKILAEIFTFLKSHFALTTHSFFPKALWSLLVHFSYYRQALLNYRTQHGIIVVWIFF